MPMGFLRWLGGRLAPAGEGGRLAILIYHRVLERPDPLRPGEVDRACFAWQMEVAARLCNILPLTEAVARLQEGTLPAGALAVTFDDGYADNLEVAAPILERLGIPATVFVATGFLDGGIMWNDMVLETFARVPLGSVDLAPVGLAPVTIENDEDRRRSAEAVIREIKYRPLAQRVQQARALAEHLDIALPRDLMLTRGQLRTLAAQDGMDIGAHTVNHPILSVLPLDEARREMMEGKAALEGILGRAVRLFAYPNGRPGQDYTDEHARMAAESGFIAAVSTQWAVNGKDSDPFQLARINVWDRTPLRFALRLLDAYRRGPQEPPLSVKGRCHD